MWSEKTSQIAQKTKTTEHTVECIRVLSSQKGVMLIDMTKVRTLSTCLMTTFRCTPWASTVSFGNPRVGKHLKLKVAGNAIGINCAGKTNDCSPNALALHALLDWTSEKCGPEKQNEVQDALFWGYFTDGIHPNVSGLLSVTASFGLNEDEVREIKSPHCKVQEKVEKNMIMNNMFQT